MSGPVACNSFRPNHWRPTTCSNCLRPKAKHASAKQRSGPPQLRKSSASSASASPSAAERCVAEAKTQSGTQQRPEAKRKQEEAKERGGGGCVEPVYPYAVVDLEAERERRKRERAANTRRGSSSIVDVRSAPTNETTASLSQSAHLSSVSCSRLNDSGSAKRRSQSFSVTFATPKPPSTRTYTVPKRRAPPPPLVRARPPPLGPKPKLHNIISTRSQRTGESREGEEEEEGIVSPKVADAGKVRTIKREGVQLRNKSSAVSSSEACKREEGEERRGGGGGGGGGSEQRRTENRESVRHRTMAEAQLEEGRSTKARVTPSTGQVGHETRQSDTIYTTVEVVGRPRTAGQVDRKWRGRDRGGGGGGVNKRAGPKKPPRTLSTFFNFPTEVGVVMEEEGEEGESEDHPSSSSSSVPLLQTQVLRLMNDSVQIVYAKFLENVLRLDSLWEVTWQHLHHPSPTSATYKGMELSVERVSKKLDSCSESEIRISQHLTPHPNLCLIRALLPPPSPAPLSSSFYYLLRDSTGDGPLSQLFPEWRKNSSPEQFHEKLLLCLVQVMSAVNHLYSNGVCHRDIGLDCLYACAYGREWLIKLGRFHYAVRHTGPITATSFVYGYQELRWLGGSDSRLPPEIMDTPGNAQTLDYGGTDCFAVGCTLYEMLGLDNPFEVDPQLIYTQYNVSSFPPFPPTSSLSSLLQRCASLLLCRDPRHRLAPPAALLLFQALLWLPGAWLDSPVPDLLVRQQLELDKASLITSLALMDIRPVPLGHSLHAHFLHNCVISELIRTLSVFQHSTE